MADQINKHFFKEIKQEPDMCTQNLELDSEVKSEDVIVKTENDELYENHVTKHEKVITPEIKDKQNTTNENNYVFKEIKQEPDISTEDKVVSDFEVKTECEDEKIEFDESTIKDEIVVEPDIIQNHIYSDSEPNSDDSNHCNTSSLENIPVACKFCNKVISSQRSLNYHVKYYCSKNTEIKRISCTLCNKVLSSQMFLDRHMRSYCLMNKEVTKPVSCELCHEILSSQKYLNNHRKYSCPMNEKIKPVSCQLCNKVISSQRYLNNHMKYSCPMNEQIKTVSCQLCNKVLSSQKYLNNHLKYSCSMNENKTKPTCKLCNEVINSRGSLYYHLKTCSMNKNKNQ